MANCLCPFALCAMLYAPLPVGRQVCPFVPYVLLSINGKP